MCATSLSGRRQRTRAEWFGVPGAWQRPHENLLSLIAMPSPFGGFPVRGFAGIRVRGGAIRATAGGDAGSGAASYGTAAIGPQENTEVVTFGLVTASGPGCMLRSPVRARGREVAHVP
jgi:hypothetical protein